MTDSVWSDASVTNLADRLVLLALADCHNPAHGCFPSIAHLAAMTTMAERSVNRSLARLIRSGKIIKKQGGGRHNTNEYMFPKTLTIGQGLPKTETLTVTTETLTATTETLTVKQGNPDQQSPFPIGGTENSEAPNRNRTVINSNIRESAAALPLSQNSDSHYHDLSEKEAGQDKGLNPLPLTHGLNGHSDVDARKEAQAEPGYLFHGADRPARPAKPTKKKTVTKKKRYEGCDVQPPFEELARYCESIGILVEAEAIEDHWRTNGFKTGKNPIQDWQAAVRTWKRRMKEFARQNTRNASSNSNTAALEESQKRIAQMAMMNKREPHQ